MRTSTNRHKPKSYVVRGFDAANQDFRSMGTRMESVPTFTEVVVTKEHEAIVALLTDMRPMSANDLIRSRPNDFVEVRGIDLVGIAAAGGQPKAQELSVIDLKIKTHAPSASYLRAYRSTVRDILKTWAEKCRVAGHRGLRANAILTPTFAVNKYTRMVEIKTRVVLSSAIFYNRTRVTVNFPSNAADFAADLDNLRSHLFDELGRFYSGISYNHSQYGRGTV